MWRFQSLFPDSANALISLAQPNVQIICIFELAHFFVSPISLLRPLPFPTIPILMFNINKNKKRHYLINLREKHFDCQPLPAVYAVRVGHTLKARDIAHRFPQKTLFSF